MHNYPNWVCAALLALLTGLALTQLPPPKEPGKDPPRQGRRPEDRPAGPSHQDDDLVDDEEPHAPIPPVLAGPIRGWQIDRHLRDLGFLYAQRCTELLEAIMADPTIPKRERQARFDERIARDPIASVYSGMQPWQVEYAIVPYQGIQPRHLSTLLSEVTGLRCYSPPPPASASRPSVEALLCTAPPAHLLSGLHRQFYRHFSTLTHDINAEIPEDFCLHDPFDVIMTQFAIWVRSRTPITEDLLMTRFRLRPNPSLHPVFYLMLHRGHDAAFPGYTAYLALPGRLVSGANMVNRQLDFASMWTRAQAMLDADSPDLVSTRDLITAIFPDDPTTSPAEPTGVTESPPRTNHTQASGTTPLRTMPLTVGTLGSEDTREVAPRTSFSGQSDSSGNISTGTRSVSDPIHEGSLPDADATLRTRDGTESVANLSAGSSTGTFTKDPAAVDTTLDHPIDPEARTTDTPEDQAPTQSQADEASSSGAQRADGRQAIMIDVGDGQQVPKFWPPLSGPESGEEEDDLGALIRSAHINWDDNDFAGLEDEVFQSTSTPNPEPTGSRYLDPQELIDQLRTGSRSSSSQSDHHTTMPLSIVTSGSPSGTRMVADQRDEEEEPVDDLIVMDDVDAAIGPLPTPPASQIGHILEPIQACRFDTEIKALTRRDTRWRRLNFVHTHGTSCGQVWRRLGATFRQGMVRWLGTPPTGTIGRMPDRSPETLDTIHFLVREFAARVIGWRSDTRNPARFVREWEQMHGAVWTPPNIRLDPSNQDRNHLVIFALAWQEFARTGRAVSSGYEDRAVRLCLEQSARRPCPQPGFSVSLDQYRGLLLTDVVAARHALYHAIMRRFGVINDVQDRLSDDRLFVERPTERYPDPRGEVIEVSFRQHPLSPLDTCHPMVADGETWAYMFARYAFLRLSHLAVTGPDALRMPAGLAAIAIRHTPRMTYGALMMWWRYVFHVERELTSVQTDAGWFLDEHGAVVEDEPSLGFLALFSSFYHQLQQNPGMFLRMVARVDLRVRWDCARLFQIPEQLIARAIAWATREALLSPSRLIMGAIHLIRGIPRPAAVRDLGLDPQRWTSLLLDWFDPLEAVTYSSAQPGPWTFRSWQGKGNRPINLKSLAGQVTSWIAMALREGPSPPTYDHPPSDDQPSTSGIVTHRDDRNRGRQPGRPVEREEGEVDSDEDDEDDGEDQARPSDPDSPPAKRLRRR